MSSERSDNEVVDPSLQSEWYGWGSPVGLGLGLLSVGGFFTLLALGLEILASIG